MDEKLNEEMMVDMSELSVDEIAELKVETDTLLMKINNLSK